MSERISDLQYVHLPSGDNPPALKPTPCRVIVIAEESVERAWQVKVSDWIVEIGCLYMMAWGKDCSLWNDSVDWANLEKFDFGDIPEENFVMTTWHENEPLEETFWYSDFCAFHPTISLDKVIILDISAQNREEIILSKYSQVILTCPGDDEDPHQSLFAIATNYVIALIERLKPGEKN